MRTLLVAWMMIFLAACNLIPPSVSQTDVPTTFPPTLPPQPVQQASPSTTPLPAPELSGSVSPQVEDPQQSELVAFILDQLSGVDRQHLLVAQVPPNPAGSRAMLAIRTESILRAWLYQDGTLMASTAEFVASSYNNEKNGQWKYAYMAFSIDQLDPEYRSATVRVDYHPGLAGGKGQQYELSRDHDQWGIKSQRNVWIQ